MSRSKRGPVVRFLRALVLTIVSVIGLVVAAAIVFALAVTGWPPTPDRIRGELSAGIRSRFIFRGPENTWWGDLVRTQWVRGTRVYVGLGTHMGVLDISDPRNPRFVTSVSTEGIVHGFAATGDILHVAHGVSGFSSWDVSDLDHPRRVGRFTGDGYGMGVAVQDHYVAYSDQRGGWYVLDVAKPSNPVQVFHDPRGNASAATIVDKRLYLADGDRGVVIWDFADPTHPLELGLADTTIKGVIEPLDPAPLWVAVRAPYAYVANGTQGLLVLDVSNPAAPTQIAHLPLDDYAYTVMLDGDRAYVADIGRGLVTVDVTDPRNPRGVSVLPTPGGAYDLTIENHLIHLSDGANGFMMVGLDDPDRPTQLGYWQVPGRTRGLLLDGDRLIASQASMGIAIYDVSDPRQPVLEGAVDTPGLVNDVALWKDEIFAADCLGGIQVIGRDAASGAWKVRSSFNIENHPWAVDTDDVHLYIANAHHGFMEFDIAGETPRITADEQSIGGYSVGITKVGDRAVLSNLVKGMAHYDVSDPTHPVLTATFPANSTAPMQLLLGLPTVIRSRVRGDLAFLAGYARGLQIVDLSDPSLLRRVGEARTGGYIYGVDLVGDTAYLADYEGRLLEVDIRDLAEPRVRRKIHMPRGEAWDVAVRDRTAFVALGTAGIGITDLDTGETRVLDNVLPKRTLATVPVPF